MKTEEKENLIPNMSSKTLAAHVVAYRSLGLFREFAVKCLKELAIRKSNGDSFDYDVFIKEELDKLPKSSIENYKNVFSMVKNISSTYKDDEKK